MCAACRRLPPPATARQLCTPRPQQQPAKPGLSRGLRCLILPTAATHRTERSQEACAAEALHSSSPRALPADATVICELATVQGSQPGAARRTASGEGYARFCSPGRREKSSSSSKPRKLAVDASSGRSSGCSAPGSRASGKGSLGQGRQRAALHTRPPADGVLAQHPAHRQDLWSAAAGGAAARHRRRLGRPAGHAGARCGARCRCCLPPHAAAPAAWEARGGNASGSAARRPPSQPRRQSKATPGRRRVSHRSSGGARSSGRCRQPAARPSPRQRRMPAAAAAWRRRPRRARAA